MKKDDPKLNFLGILFYKNWKNMELIYTTSFQVPTGVTSIRKILYAIHIELSPFLPALAADSPVLSYLL